MSPCTSGELLSIDVDAEVRTLCGRQFASYAERISEWIRMAISGSAKSVAVVWNRRGVELTAPGALLSNDVLGLLKVIRDPQQQSGERHQAMLSCEQEFGAGPLALLAEPDVTVITSEGCLAWSRKGKVQHHEHHEHHEHYKNRELRPLRPEEPLTIRIRVRAWQKDGERALKRACRFSTVPIYLNGRRVSSGMKPEAAFANLRMSRDGVTVAIGLPVRDELCHTTYLRSGLVARDVYGVSTQGYAHVAVVSHGDDADIDFMRVLLRDARAQLYERLSASIQRIPAEHRRQARNLLFRRCESVGDDALIEGLPLFERIEGEAVDIQALRNAMHGGVLWAVEWAVDIDRAKRRRRPWIGDMQRVFRLDGRQRAFLTRDGDLTLVEPPVRIPRRFWRRIRPAALIKAATRAVEALLKISVPRLAIAHGLSESERRLQTAVQEELRAGRFLIPGLPAAVSQRTQVEFVEKGPVPVQVQPFSKTRAGKRLLAIPRNHPLVIRMQERLAEDPRNIYPVLSVMLGGSDGYGPRKLGHQQAWLRE